MARNVLGLVACAALAGCAKAPHADEAAAIRAAFDGYKQAILDRDGERAVSFVDASTLAYYGRMRELALRGDRSTVAALSTMDKLMVLTIRHRMPAESVERMTAETLFVHAVDEGWIGRQSVADNELGEVAVSGSSATGVHVSAGRRSPLKWAFRKEGGRWGLDLASFLPAADQAMKQVIRQSGRPEDEFLASLLESVSGTQVPDTVWEPMIR